MQDYTIQLSYIKAGKSACEFLTTEGHYTNDDVAITLTNTDGRITVALEAMVPIAAVNIALTLPLPQYNKLKFYANGYQSWSYSREYSYSDKYNGISNAIKPMVKMMAGHMVGDYTFVKYPKRKGVFNSCSHCYVREGGSNDIKIYGSSDDRLGYTYFTANLHSNKLTITRDLEGMSLDIGCYNLLDVYEVDGEYNAAWDKYFSLIDIKPRTDTKLCGYTSWYNYYRNINESLLTRDLESLVAIGSSDVNVFQIDDGYQPFIGDLTRVDARKFPQGMRHMSDLIHSKGLLAGLWACPFGVTPFSQTFRQHPDWLLRNSKGRLIKVGAAWGGFFALDFYNMDAREYIRSSLKVMVDDWNFDMLKLDFLYAACVIPRNGKTRATIMYEVMDFLRDTLGEDKFLLACGAPIMPCYGVADYCRIGADISLGWANVLDKQICREIVSTRKSIINTTFRRYLDKRAFLNDPDVFILRDFNTSMSNEQKRILSYCNKMFGSVLFMSDDAGGYSDEVKAQLAWIYRDADFELLGADIIDKHTLFLRYTVNGNEKIFIFNYQTSEIFRDQRVDE